jgi:Fe-S-cluster containining protein
LVIGLKFQNVTFPENIGFICRNCGQCCKEQPADVTVEEQKRIEALGYTDFLDPTDLSEPRLLKSRTGGGCFFLGANGCLVHGVKPAICGLVPFVVVDWDYERDLIEVDLPADCACPGITSSGLLPVESLSKAAQAYVHGLLELTAKQENLASTDLRVLSKTRMLIIQLANGDDLNL